MGKTIEDLKKSRQTRKEVTYKYGEVLSSVWDIKYGNDLIVEFEERKQNTVAQRKFHKEAEYDPTLKKNFKMSGISCRGTTEDSGLSTFPPDIVKKVVLFYTDKNDLVLDPFAGHNSRMQMTHFLNRNYIGYDVSKKFMDFNREIASNLTSSEGKLVDAENTITLKETSSENINEADNSCDLVFTSPPYYKVEYYTDEKDQLYFCPSYEVFLERMEVILRQCFRALKEGKYCVFNVNDFRYKGKFYCYHADIINLFRKVGFEMWDMIIVKWSNSIKTCFASQIENEKVVGKKHEYIIVGKKPVTSKEK